MLPCLLKAGGGSHPIAEVVCVVSTRFVRIMVQNLPIILKFPFMFQFLDNLEHRKKNF